MPLVRRRRAEPLDAEHDAVVADPAVPATSDAPPRSRRASRPAAAPTSRYSRRLRARTARGSACSPRARATPSPSSFFCASSIERDLRAARHQHDFAARRPARRPARRRPSPRPPPTRTSSRSMKPSFWRVSTSATGPFLCLSATRHASAVSVASAGRITVKSGNRAQRRQLLDRLVRRSVLAEPDRVVREDVDHVLLHERREPHRRPHVVREDQERAAVRDHAAVQRHAVHDRRPCRARGCRSGSCARRSSSAREALPRP